jgi:arginase
VWCVPKIRRVARIGVIGVPTSAGAFAPGQEDAPAALRAAGLVQKLAGATDHGDRERFRWRPDRERPYAQNLGQVVEIVQDTARRVAEVETQGEFPLVLGGDCTVGIGTVAGTLGPGGRVGLVYLDLHADLNVPRSVRPGALDWMGMAHMLGEHDAEAELVEAGPRTPMLEPDQVVLLGWGPDQAQPREREAIERLNLTTVPCEEVEADPRAAAHKALESLDGHAERILVHFDVDLVDFTDTPLSENTGRNEGLPYATVIEAFHALLKDPRIAGLTLTELNPHHAEDGANSIERLARDLAAGLTTIS